MIRIYSSLKIIQGSSEELIEGVEETFEWELFLLVGQFELVLHSAFLMLHLFRLIVYLTDWLLSTHSWCRAIINREKYFRRNLELLVRFIEILLTWYRWESVIGRENLNLWVLTNVLCYDYLLFFNVVFKNFLLSRCRLRLICMLKRLFSFY